MEVAVIGAAGAMGTRITSTMSDEADINLRYVEQGEVGLQKLADRGLTAARPEDAVPGADVVILAVPDPAIKAVSAAIVPLMSPGALMMCLDPAAPFAGHLPERSDVAYFAVHPCHPPVFNDETDPEARRDFFGGGKAKQAIVCCLIQGSEADYERGERVANLAFAPVLRTHRVTLDQMIMLEPGLSETVAATCIAVMRDALDIAVSRGVPLAAARDFILGHINVELAILFEEADYRLSASAYKAIAAAKADLFKPGLEKVFDLGYLRQTAEMILDVQPAKA